MARTAVVRSASLTPSDARLADDLAALIAHGSFSQLTQVLLHTVGVPLQQRIEDLQASGLDPLEHLVVLRPTPPDTDEQERRFYGSSTWPASGPSGA